MRTPQRNDHLPPILAGIVNSLTPKVPKPPCRCDRLSFPHRRAWQCDAHADHALDINDRADRAYDDAVQAELDSREA